MALGVSESRALPSVERQGDASSRVDGATPMSVLGVSAIGKELEPSCRADLVNLDSSKADFSWFMGSGTEET